MRGTIIESRRMDVSWLGWGLALGIAVACSGAGGETPEEGGATMPPESEALVEMARQDLAGRTGADPNAIGVVSVQEVEWSDAGLGCPEPDRVYAQVITPGYRIVLSVDSEQHVYHSSRSRAVYCPPERRRADGVESSILS